MSSTWGNNIKISIFGESHAAAIGVSMDGVPGGVKINEAELQAFMQKRQAVDPAISTPRKEEDIPQILCGVKNGITEGTPIAMVIANKNVRSQDYGDVAHICRPGHADYTGMIRYHGYNDYRGGGHFSGRLTASLVAAGGICRQILQKKGIRVFSHIYSIKDVYDTPFDPVKVGLQEYEKLAGKQIAVLDDEKGAKMRETILNAKKQSDSVGGIIECAVTGLPAGIGSPMFDGMENAISRIIFGIPAVKGIEFGNGFAATSLFGSENNDTFYYEENTVKTRTNNHGGILGGITSGMPLIFRVAVKPTATIGKEQNSIDFDKKENAKIQGKGRHDPCIVPRALACVEAATSLAVLDEWLDFQKENSFYGE